MRPGRGARASSRAVARVLLRERVCAGARERRAVAGLADAPRRAPPGWLAAASYVTAASVVIRFTLASSTPGAAASAFCTRAWHAAQVMPETWIVTRAGAGFGYESSLAGSALRAIARP